MNRIRVKNFGPVKRGLDSNEGWLDFNKVTIFIGGQGSGKSSIAKLISTFTWIEKALVRGDLTKKEVENYDRFKKRHCAYQNIHNFFHTNTELEFEGRAYHFSYKNGKFKVQKHTVNGFQSPKIMYVPAERNFVSAVVQPEKLKYLPQPLYTFLEEFIRSNEEIEEDILLPVNDLAYRFDKKKRAFRLIGKQYEILLSEASSGLQSAIPLFLVSKNLAEGIHQVHNYSKSRLSIETKQKLRDQLLKILQDKGGNDNIQSAAMEILSSMAQNDYFVNIVEEPEQNLFPKSQWAILKSLLEFNNMNESNRLLITTHSPYLINYMNLAIQAHALGLKMQSGNDDTLHHQLNSIVPQTAQISGQHVSIYQFDEKTGNISLLPQPEGIPSGDNYLNNILREGNYLFDALLELEQELWH